MPSTHYFFALALPDEVKKHIAKIRGQLQEDYPFKSWVHREDYHMTLAFLGNAKAEQLADAVIRVRETLEDFPSFPLMLEGIGTFGRSDLPRILWLNTTESKQLSKLREKVFTSCERAGFQLETRPFKPHITIARRWMDKDNFHLEGMKESLGPLLHGPAFTTEEAVLYETHLDRLPKYEKVESFQFI